MATCRQDEEMKKKDKKRKGKSQTVIFHACASVVLKVTVCCLGHLKNKTD